MCQYRDFLGLAIEAGLDRPDQASQTGQTNLGSKLAPVAGRTVFEVLR